jgi:hypothetical protein
MQTTAQLQETTTSPSTSRSMREVLEELESAIHKMQEFFKNVDRDDLPKLLTAFRQLQEHKKYLDSLSTDVEKLYQVLSYTIIPDIFQSRNVESMKIGGKNFILSNRLHATITADQKEKAFEWLRKNGLEDIVQPNVNHKTLTSALGNLLEDKGISPPADVIKIHTQNYIQVRSS